MVVLCQPIAAGIGSRCCLLMDYSHQVTRGVRACCYLLSLWYQNLSWLSLARTISPIGNVCAALDIRHAVHDSRIWWEWCSHVGWILWAPPTWFVNRWTVINTTRSASAIRSLHIMPSIPPSLDTCSTDPSVVSSAHAARHPSNQT